MHPGIMLLCIFVHKTITQTTVYYLAKLMSINVAIFVPSKHIFKAGQFILRRQQSTTHPKTYARHKELNTIRIFVYHLVSCGFDSNDRETLRSTDSPYRRMAITNYSNGNNSQDIHHQGIWVAIIIVTRAFTFHPNQYSNHRKKTHLPLA